MTQHFLVCTSMNTSTSIVIGKINHWPERGKDLCLSDKKNQILGKVKSIGASDCADYDLTVTVETKK